MLAVELYRGGGGVDCGVGGAVKQHLGLRKWENYPQTR